MRVIVVLTGLVAEIALTALFPYVAGQRITSQEQRSPSNNHEEINCKVPGTNGTYSPWNGKYCVYALGYTELAYEKDIFYNDKTKSYARDVDVVTIATCWQDELLKTKYSGGLMRIAGRSVNLFFACCKRCEEFDSPKDEILLKLKNVFTAYSVLNMKKIYDVVVGENSRENVMYRERYLVRLNKGGIMERIELPTCLSEGFRLAPSLIYTPICWVKTNWKGHCEICGDKADKQYLNIEASGKLNSKFGPFDAYRVHAMEETYCSNFFDKAIPQLVCETVCSRI
uniref:Uncharacterized protein n=3 Tax=Parascaris univalens TaxID=6257 RepID=A0A915A1D6_PARUN